VPVAGVPFGEDVLVVGAEVGRVGGERGGSLAPQPGLPGGEGGVGDGPGDFPAGVGGEVAAPNVAQVILGVGVIARGDGPDPGVGAVGVGHQQQPLEQYRGVDALPGAR
jgi:hypothetical protein